MLYIDQVVHGVDPKFLMGLPSPAPRRLLKGRPLQARQVSTPPLLRQGLNGNTGAPPAPCSPIVGCVGPRRGRVSWNLTRICRAFEWGDAVASFARTVPLPRSCGDVQA